MEDETIVELLYRRSWRGNTAPGFSGWRGGSSKAGRMWRRR